MGVKSKNKLLPFQQKLSPEKRKLNRFADELCSKRSCGDCMACCTVIGVEEINKPEFTTCNHLCDIGCRIYKSRPAQCRNYVCGWRALWTPNDENWRPDHLGVIFDVHEHGMGGPAVRCWQLRSETQILDDPNVRRMAYALSVQMKIPVVARYGHVENASVHLIHGLREIRYGLSGLQVQVPIFLLTHDVISDPTDFDRKRESLTDHEFNELMNQFGHKAFLKNMFE